MLALNRKAESGNEQGFTLIEVMISMLVLLIGLVSLAELFAVAMHANAYSFNNGAATVAAQDKIEEFHNLDFDDTTGPGAQIQVTLPGVNTLDANVSNYNDATGTFIRRWSVAQGSTPDTRVVTLRIIPTITDPRRAKQQITVTTILVKP
jgi:type IV pilus assembly protein PilV